MPCLDPQPSMSCQSLMNILGALSLALGFGRLYYEPIHHAKSMETFHNVLHQFFVLKDVKEGVVCKMSFDKFYSSLLGERSSFDKFVWIVSLSCFRSWYIKLRLCLLLVGLLMYACLKFEPQSKLYTMLWKVGFQSSLF